VNGGDSSESEDEGRQDAEGGPHSYDGFGIVVKVVFLWWVVCQWGGAGAPHVYIRGSVWALSVYFCRDRIRLELPYCNAGVSNSLNT
jgi:hypothetical protein